MLCEAYNAGSYSSVMLKVDGAPELSVGTLPNTVHHPSHLISSHMRPIITSRSRSTTYCALIGRSNMELGRLTAALISGTRKMCYRKDDRAMRRQK